MKKVFYFPLKAKKMFELLIVLNDGSIEKIEKVVSRAFTNAV